MNNQEAKFILRAYRPSGRDAGDATFAAALQQARMDPALGAWLAREQAGDTAVAARLRAIPAPAGLKESILTGARVSTAPRARRRPPTWLAMAASIALLVTLAATYWLRNAGPAPVGLDQIAGFALADPWSAHTGPHADKLGAFGTWLENPASHLAAMPAVDLAQLKTDGCRTVNMGGHEVFEICFKRGDGIYHLYLARRDGSAKAPENGPVFREEGHRSVVAWADQRMVYTLMSGQSMESLRRLL